LILANPRLRQLRQNPEPVKRIFTALLLMCCLTARAAEVIPPPPKQYFNDYARVVRPNTAAGLNQTLEDFERETSSQILVVVFPKMQSDSSIEDYTVRVAQSWRAGQKGKDNGAVLFVFTQDRKLFLQVGYGLEGALPDALCKRIIEDEIKPHFKNGDFDGGLTAGVQAIIAATRGEYKGTGNTVATRGQAGPGILFIAVFGLIALLILLALVRAVRGGTVYHRRGRSNWGGWIVTGGGSSGGWGGGGSSGGGGGFSAGGGSFGGGGAGGSW
jgi:uncharacterized protein